MDHIVDARADKIANASNNDNSWQISTQAFCYWRRWFLETTWQGFAISTIDRLRLRICWPGWSIHFIFMVIKVVNSEALYAQKKATGKGNNGLEYSITVP